MHANRFPVSVIVPTRDRPESITCLLNALYRQEMSSAQDTEIIVVDDHSHRATSSYIASLCARFGIRYIRHTIPRGAAAARNTGIRTCRGQWCAFLDDDIILLPRWLDRVHEYTTSLNTNLSVVGIEGAVSAQGDGIWDREVQVHSGGAFLSCNIVYRKERLKECGLFDTSFNARKPSGEDQELALRMLAGGSIVFRPLLHVCHRSRDVAILRYIRDSVARIDSILSSEYHIYRLHPTGYRRIRHYSTALRTHMALIAKSGITQLRRRSLSQLVKHPLHTAALCIAACTEQVAALCLLPKYLLSLCFASRIPTQLRHIRRVWYLASIPPGSQGGVHRVMHQQMKGLAMRGYITRNIYNKGGHHDFVFALTCGIRFLAALLSPRVPDVIIARSTDGVVCACLIRLLRLQTRCLLHNHGWEEVAAVSRVQNLLHAGAWKSRLLRFPLLRLHLHTAHLCVCETVADMRWLTYHYPQQAHKLRYVPTGVTPVTPVHRFGRDVPLRVLAVGQYSQRKNIDYVHSICNEWAQRSDTRISLYLVGVGTRGVTLISNLTSHPKLTVYTIAHESMDSMSQWYSYCPFVISASRYEGGHSLALLEAMTHGCMVFASPIRAHREFIRHGCNGFLLHGNDVTCDSKFISSIYAHAREYQHIGTHAAHSAQRHRWSRQVARMEHALSTLTVDNKPNKPYCFGNTPHER